MKETHDLLEWIKTERKRTDANAWSEIVGMPVAQNQQGVVCKHHGVMHHIGGRVLDFSRILQRENLQLHQHLYHLLSKKGEGSDWDERKKNLREIYQRKLPADKRDPLVLSVCDDVV